MAKRRSEEEDEFDPFREDIDEFNVDALRTPTDEDEDEDNAPAAKPAKQRRQRSGGGGGAGIGQLIGGLIQAILIAVLALAIFLALGFGVTFGGQKLGLIATHPAPIEVVQSVTLPTQVPQNGGAPQNNQPTLAPDQPTLPPAPPTATPDLGCPTATTWWNSQQVQDSYQYFTTKAITESRGSSRIPALLQQMQIRRDFVANFPADPCLTAARDALLHGFDEIINAVRSVSTTDETGVATHQTNATLAFAQVTAELWADNANIDADSPPSVGVARGSGAACGAQDWYTATKAQLDAFFSAAAQIDVKLQPNQVRTLLDNMQSARANIASSPTPDCAAKPQLLLLDALSSDVAYFQQTQSGATGDAQRADFAAKYGLFSAWIQWLGVT